jgi:hypothetical protein
MKKIIVFIALSVMAIQIRAQITFANSTEIKLFLKSTTYVVEDGNPFSSFNDTIKSCMKKFWTITPYEFITVEEFETKKLSNANSFIMLSEAEQYEDKVKCTYNFLNLILGGTADLNKMPDLGSVPLSYVDVSEDEYLYKLGGILIFMQTHVKYASEHSTIKPTLIDKDSKTDIKTKELWLLQAELPADLNTLEKIKEVYPFTVKLVTKEEINKAIADKNADVVYLHKVGPEGTITGGKCWKFLVTAKEGEVLYYDGHIVTTSNPDAFLKSDFKAIAK